MIDKNKPIMYMTAGEFIELVSELKIDISPPIEKVSDELIYGISGLAKLLKVSKTTAQRYHSSGVLNEAKILHNNRKIIFQKNKVLTLLNQL